MNYSYKYKILVVNLKRREDRKNNIIQLFDSINFEKYDFYPAYDGKNIDLSYEIRYLFQGNDFGNRKCFIGCALSHYNIWIDLINDEDSDYYIIFEDDITLSSTFKEDLEKCKENVNNLDFLLLGYHSYIENIEDQPTEKLFFQDLDRNNFVGGTHGYIITKNGAKRILEYIEKNGIKHGIDYLFKINLDLKIQCMNRKIVIADWVNNNRSNVDSDIQKDYDSFNFNILFDYNNYLFIKGYDQLDNDYGYLSPQNINQLFIESTKNDIVSGFNTLGYLKKNINKLDKSQWFHKNDGIFIKLDKVLRVKLIGDWISSKALCDDWRFMSKGDYRWNNIRITSDDNDIDYYIIINGAVRNEYYIPEKTVYFRMEPYGDEEQQKSMLQRWGPWANPDPSLFLKLINQRFEMNNCMWQLNKSYTELLNNSPKKEYNFLSTICSSKYFDKGHIKRIDFLKYLESKNDVQIDIYGIDNNHNFKNYKRPLSTDKKEDGIFPYKYYFMVENTFENNYITEKIWEPIISESLVFYCGAPNVEEYINPKAFVKLNLDNFEESYNVIKNAINNDLWSERIDIIRREKYKILNYYNFFPRVERILTKDMYKDKLFLINSNTKIYIINESNQLDIKTELLINMFGEFNFTIEVINNINYINSVNIDQKYNNYMILDGSLVLNTSINDLFNHIFYLPKEYDFVQLYKSENKPFKFINQHNSLYYNVKKYHFETKFAHIISKNGLNKINKINIDSISQYYRENNNFNFYAIHDNHPIFLST
jgi:GR25 family glycosyltransferase involved in LPS biosynthesis